MKEGKYFSTNKKGELFELKNDLNSEKPEKRKAAIKQTIASMTVGKDMGSLLPDIIACSENENLEVKKLVYLFVMNYARTYPDMAVLSVNSFKRDLADHNPLLRALAIRTMACIRVNKISEHLLAPLNEGLKDKDPYVRKTCAIAVAKLYDLAPDVVAKEGFLPEVKKLLLDSNPMVVANAVAALSEIQALSSQDVIGMNQTTMNSLLTALGECTEWGQVYIIDLVSKFQPETPNDAINTCDRIMKRLQSGNSAVVMSAVRLLLNYTKFVNNPAYSEMLVRKLGPPMVTLLSLGDEIKYVALRNISLILQKWPTALQNELKVFFVKYNDPIYVKMQKLDIIVRLTKESNITQVLNELRQYSTEADIAFVRKSVQSIGQCAIKIDIAADQCIDTLMELVATKVNYVVQEAITVIRDIFRRYPNRYEGVIAKLCENLETLDEPEAKAAMIWIIGEYSDRIDNADELLESFLDGYLEETSCVQFQLLTGIVKLFLRRPQTSQKLVQKILKLTTEQAEDPDLRDRGYIYWRLLSTDPALAKRIVLAEKPLIMNSTEDTEPKLLEELTSTLGSLASVYHRHASEFVGKPRRKKSAGQAILRNQNSENNTQSQPQGQQLGQSSQTANQGQTSLIGELLDLSIEPAHAQLHTQPQPQPQPQHFQNQEQMQQIVHTNSWGTENQTDFSSALVASTTSIQSYVMPMQMWLDAQKGKGLEILGRFVLRQNQIIMEMSLNNKALTPMSNFAIQFNKNSFAIIPQGSMQVNPPQIMPNMAPAQAIVLVNTTGPVQRMDPLNRLQVALKCNMGVLFFDCPVPHHVMFTSDGGMEREVYLQSWRDISEKQEVLVQLGNVSVSEAQVESVLRANNVFTVAKRNVDGRDLWYTSLKYTNGIWVMVELSLLSGTRSGTVAVRTKTRDVVDGVCEAFRVLLAPQ
eukprot:CFRG4592T1